MAVRRQDDEDLFLRDGPGDLGLEETVDPLDGLAAVFRRAPVPQDVETREVNRSDLVASAPPRREAFQRATVGREASRRAREHVLVADDVAARPGAGRPPAHRDAGNAGRGRDLPE